MFLFSFPCPSSDSIRNRIQQHEKKRFLQNIFVAFVFVAVERGGVGDRGREEMCEGGTPVQSKGDSPIHKKTRGGEAKEFFFTFAVKDRRMKSCFFFLSFARTCCVLVYLNYCRDIQI
jgi:hypothetical protein